jgi:hypothetical protein
VIVKEKIEGDTKDKSKENTTANENSDVKETKAEDSSAEIGQPENGEAST